MPKIPDKNIDFKVYDSSSSELYGIAEVTLPDFEAMSEELSGAGMSGAVETPVLGHFGSMTCSFKWRTITKEATALMAQKAHQLDLRGSCQSYDSEKGVIESYPVKLTVKAIPKKFGLGSFNVGKSGDGESEFELTYIKMLVDNEEVVELDKYNYIFRVHGTDYLESVRKDLGVSG